MGKKSVSIVLLGVALAVGAANAQVVVRTAPPPPRKEVRVARPGAGYLWQGGYYRWDGRAYVWAPGVWVRPPQPYYHHWVPGHWRKRGGGWVWVEGHWKR